MCLTRKPTRIALSRLFSVRFVAPAGVIAGGLAILTGCQANTHATMDRLNNTPLVVDQAMQARDWDRSTTYYGNGDTIAGGTGYLFEKDTIVPPPYRRVADVPMSVLNIVAEPVGLFVNSPFTPHVYQGAVLPPSSTLQPVLP